ncbi:MAG: N-6 DNA methylase [Ardenticatenaceae bacterium]
MAIKKSELYSSLWESCDQLRGGMDASQYKDYVLVLLFVKYVSDKYAGQPDALIEVPVGGSFADMVALKGDKEIGDQMNVIISRLAEANDLKGVIDVADFNDPDKLGKGKEMVDRLSNLVAIFSNPALDFSRNRAEGDDILGDAYEYLMRHFATQSGKSKGQFYTPAEVSRIMAQVIGISQAQSPSQTIYDPTCGSGSLLLKAADETPRGITIYGQEMDNATAALAKMNMILHDNPTAEIWQANTLATPYFKGRDGSLKRFDFVVANPPFSSKAWSNGFDPAHDQYGRFGLGIPPNKNGDYAFLLHILSSLKNTGSTGSTGKGAVILPHGVLFRGNAEATIRQNIIQRGYIKGIIGLPANLFYGTGIPACIIVLDKAQAAGRRGIFMVDASKGFVKDGNKNRLRHQDIRKIVDVFTKQLDVPQYARLVSYAELAANEYNLNIPRYIDSSQAEDVQDIAAHLLGGIPQRDIDELGGYWQVFPTLKERLFSIRSISQSSRPGYVALNCPASEIKATIFSYHEFVAYIERVKAVFDGWQAQNLALLMEIRLDSAPKPLIGALSESLLQHFSEVPLIDKYDVYQHLMSYWTETMQDDLYLIAADGWQEASKLRLIVERKGQKNKEKADLVLGRRKYKADLIPPALLIKRYFAAEAQAIEALAAEKDAISRQIEEMAEEHGGEEGLLAEASNQKGKITKSSLNSRLKEIKRNPDDAEERALLKAYLALMSQESAKNKEIKDARKALDKQLINQYAALSENEIKTLVVHDKWLATLAANVQSELDRLSQTLTRRIQELAERYATPLPQLVTQVEHLSANVDAHLERMGFVWK